MVITYPGQDVELMCTGTTQSQTVSWIINDMGTYEVSTLLNGILTGYSSSGNNLIVQDIIMNDVRNRSNFLCVINATRAILRQSYPTVLHVAGEDYCYNSTYIRTSVRVYCNVQRSIYVIHTYVTFTDYLHNIYVRKILYVCISYVYHSSSKISLLLCRVAEDEY